MKDLIGYFFFCLMPCVNFCIAEWSVGGVCQVKYGWPYVAGVLLWAGINIGFTILGGILMTRSVKRGV